MNVFYNKRFDFPKFQILGRSGVGAMEVRGSWVWVPGYAWFLLHTQYLALIHLL